MSPSFFQEISSFASAFPGIDLSAMPRISEQFCHIPSVSRSRTTLWPKLSIKYPELFSTVFSRSNGSVVSLREQEETRSRILSDAMMRGASGCASDASQTIAASYTDIDRLYKKILLLFPHEQFVHAFRVKDVVLTDTLVGAAFPRWVTDVVGARVVPRDVRAFPSMIRAFEDAFADDILFKLNTFPFADDVMLCEIGPFSIPYRAVHYYLPLGSYCFEVQFRSPAIDVWSAIHHDTMYKPRVPLSTASRDALMRFGEECCVVDAYGMLEGHELIL